MLEDLKLKTKLEKFLLPNVKDANCKRAEKIVLYKIAGIHRKNLYCDGIVYH